MADKFLEYIRKKNAEKQQEEITTPPIVKSATNTSQPKKSLLEKAKTGQVKTPPKSLLAKVEKRDVMKPKEDASWLEKLGYGIGQLGIGAGKGILKTVRGTGEVLEKAGRLLPGMSEAEKGKTLAERIVPEKAITATNPYQKAGQTLEQVAEYFIPGSASLKVGKAVGGAVKGAGTLAKVGRASTRIGSTALAEGVLGAGQMAMQEGELGEEELVKGGLYSTAASLALGAGGAAYRGIKKALSPVEVKYASALRSGIDKGFKPSKRSVVKGMDTYTADADNAVRTITENKNNLILKTSEGETIAGKLPETRAEMEQAVRQTLKSEFQKYNQFAKESGAMGARVSTKSISDVLLEAGNDKLLNVRNPRMAESLAEESLRWKKLKDLGIDEAQDELERLNSSLSTFYNNPDYNSFARATIDAGIANNLRIELDNTISSIQGEGWRELRNRYKALKTIQDDIQRGAAVEMRRNIKGLIDFSDIFSGGQIIGGLTSVQPATIASGLTSKAIASVYKYLNSPERAIKNMFELAEQLPVRPAIKPQRPKIAGLLPEKAGPSGTLYMPPPPKGDITPPPFNPTSKMEAKRQAKNFGKTTEKTAKENTGSERYEEMWKQESARKRYEQLLKQDELNYPPAFNRAKSQTTEIKKPPEGKAQIGAVAGIGLLGLNTVIGAKLLNKPESARTKEVKNILRRLGIKEEHINQIRSVKEHPSKSYYGYDDFFTGQGGMVDPKNKSIYLEPNATVGTILEEAIHNIDLSGEGFSGFPVKQFNEDWNKATETYPGLKVVEEDLPKDRALKGYSTQKSSIELEKLAFLVRSMHEYGMKISELPKELQKYVKFYFEE